MTHEPLQILIENEHYYYMKRLYQQELQLNTIIIHTKNTKSKNTKLQNVILRKQNLQDMHISTCLMMILQLN